MSEDSPAGRRRDAYAVLRFRDFRLLVIANFLASLAQAMISITVGWELYERTGSAFALGMVGLVQIVPNVIISLPAGQIVDRSNQQRIAVLATALVAVASLVLSALSFTDGPLPLIYVGLFLIGVARAFRSPTQGALLAAIIPADNFTNASAWSSSANQTAGVLGPALGGVAIAVAGSPAPVYAMSGVMLAVAAAALAMLRPRPIERSREKISLDSLLAGIRFIRSRNVLFAAIILDMVAVLLGGATALLPIFAEDVLGVGATGLGVLRAAPAVGAVVTSFAIAHHGPFRNAGPTLLLTVAGFGLATILFGASSSFGISLVALALIGGFDAVSMVIRNTMQLTYTPDHMRGRVGSIHFLFVGLSNELGEFESGVAAALLGASLAVVAGGIGTLAVVAVIAVRWPELRHLRRIEPEETTIPAGAAAIRVADEGVEANAR